MFGDHPPHQVSLPSTLRYMGGESFYCLHFNAFTLPEQLEVLEAGAFEFCFFDVLRIESTLPAQELLNSFYDCTVITYEVPEDHPLYHAIDGVLFFKDGKTLLAYPGGRTDEHYDVPAGVEHIWPYAFGTDYLKTISLLIGLKTHRQRRLCHLRQAAIHCRAADRNGNRRLCILALRIAGTGFPARWFDGK